MVEILPPLPAPRLTIRGTAIVLSTHVLLGAAYAANVTWETGIAFQLTFPRAMIDASVKLLLILPVWFVIIRAMDQKPWAIRLAAHGIAVALYVGTWQWAYGQTVTMTGALPIYPGSEMWNVFLATIIYTTQFAIFHLVREHACSRNREELAAELRSLAAQAELASLRNQVMPHFLFNILHSLSSAVPRDYEHLRTRIARLGNLLRYTLHASDRELVTLQDELVFTQDYLFLEKTRLGDRLHLSYDIEEAALSAKIPPVILQSLVENALKHGIDTNKDGGSIKLSIRRTDHLAVVTVRDSTGLPTTSNPPRISNGVGLANCAARLRGLLGPKASLRAAPTKDGFVAEIMVPTAL